MSLIHLEHQNNIGVVPSFISVRSLKRGNEGFCECYELSLLFI